MTSPDMLSINNVAAKLGLSVHQLRRWELMFGLEIKRGRGQQRQYREEDMSVLERIKELVEQGWPTSQIRPQLEAEGLLSPKLIGIPPAPGNPEVLQEAIIGLRNFSERRFIDLSKQIDELRQLLISVTLKQELSADRSSPWQPLASEYVPAPKVMPAQEITIGPQISIDPPKSPAITPAMINTPARVNQIPPSPSQSFSPTTTASGTSNLSNPSNLSNLSNPSTSAPSSTGTSSSTGNPAASSSAYSPRPTIGASSSTQNPATANTSSSGEFSQRSIIGSTMGSTSSASGESKPTIPDISQAPQPITDALQRSMSTLDSLFKDPRNTPGGASEASRENTAPSTSSTSNPAVPPVRHSTIPPMPATAQTAPVSSAPDQMATTSSSTLPAATAPAAGPTPAAALASTAAEAPPTPPTPPSPPSPLSPSTASNPYSPFSSSPAASSPAPVAGSTAGPSPPAAYPASTSPSTNSTTSFASMGNIGQTAAPSLPEEKPAAPAPTNAWDQAFASTSVDVNALPASGLFEESPAIKPSPPQSTSSGPSFSSINSRNEQERNPFTTITGTNHDAVSSKPTDSGSFALLGQTEASSQGFAAANVPPQQLSQTGPLPAHTSVESFAPEQREQIIDSQSVSTSTELPQSQAAPPPPVQPVLQMPAGPQVNFGPNVSAPTPQVTAQRVDDNFGLGEVTDQNYLTVLGRALDLIGWSDEQADSYSLKTFGVPHWDELGRSQAEKLVAHLVGLLKDQLNQ